MKHDYTVHSKTDRWYTPLLCQEADGFPELGAASIMAGYGMHADFDKARDIAGVDDPEARKKLRGR